MPVPRLLFGFLFGAVFTGVFSPGVSAEPQAEGATMSPIEQAFAELLSGSALVGRFTDNTANGPPTPERYELGEVRKVADGKWLLQTRIRYGDHDVTLPITLPVAWAGDAAVIVVDNVGFPGLGVFSARVLIHDGRYAGYWQGGGHGGHLFGVIEKPPRVGSTEPGDAAPGGAEVESAGSR